MIKELCEKLKNDPYYCIDWQVDIAASFQDEFSEWQSKFKEKPNMDEVDLIANMEAENFLNRLCEN